MHDALDEFLVGARHFGRQRDPHPLHERSAADEAAGVEIRARHARRDHLEWAQLVVGDEPAWPGMALHRPQRQPDLAFPRTHQRRFEDLRQHQRVVQRIVRLHLADSPVCRQRLQAHVVAVEAKATGELDGAHDGVDGQLDRGEFGLRGQERIVEVHVVGDQGATAQHLDQLGATSAKVG